MNLRVPNLTPSVLRRLGIVYLVLSSSWLLAPGLTRAFRAGPNLISEYESAASLYGPIFHLCDVLAALVLVGTTFLIARSIASRWGRYVPRLIALMALLMTIDVAVPVQCRMQQGICAVQSDGFSTLHGIESLLLGTAVFGLALYLAWKYRYAMWFLVAQPVAFAAGYEAAQFGGSYWLFVIQASYQLMQAFWLYGIVFDPPSRQTEPPVIARTPVAGRWVRNVTALWVAFNGLVALLLSTHHLVYGRITHPLVFAGNTPWLLGHTLLVGVLLLYLARQLWLGDRRAMVIVAVLLVSEVLHASLSHRSWLLVPLFAAPLLLLIYYRSVFDRRGSFIGFTSRFRFLVGGVVVIAALTTLVTVAFRVHDHRAWDRSPYDVGRVIRRVALLEVSADRRDSVRVVMFDRLLTLLGSSVYIWLMLGVFLPRSSFQPSGKYPGIEDMRAALERGSRSSEDYFKLWPEANKRYLRTPSGALTAYTLASGVIVALADPVLPPADNNRLRDAIAEFLQHCRSDGYKSLWLVVGPEEKGDYEAAGYGTLQIGSSARVDIARFNEKTLHNKWWRWQMNRAGRQGYRYECSTPPHAAGLMAQVRNVSDAWLQRPGHREQSFAMGYLDERYLNACRLHCLYDGDGNLAAFANELPIFNRNPQTTVDLIRFLPEADGAMPVLLAHTLKQLHQEGEYTYFDLGLVPLAEVDTRVAKLIKQFTSSRFSAHGLARFKNKFEPEWRPGYLAYDGDSIDLAKALVALNKALEYEPKQNS